MAGTALPRGFTHPPSPPAILSAGDAAATSLTPPSPQGAGHEPASPLTGFERHRSPIWREGRSGGVGSPSPHATFREEAAPPGGGRGEGGGGARPGREEGLERRRGGGGAARQVRAGRGAAGLPGTRLALLVRRGSAELRARRRSGLAPANDSSRSPRPRRSGGPAG